MAIIKAGSKAVTTLIKKRNALIKNFRNLKAAGDPYPYKIKQLRNEIKNLGIDISKAEDAKFGAVKRVQVSPSFGTPVKEAGIGGQRAGEAAKEVLGKSVAGGLKPKVKQPTPSAAPARTLEQQTKKINQLEGKRKKLRELKRIQNPTLTQKTEIAKLTNAITALSKEVKKIKKARKTTAKKVTKSRAAFSPEEIAAIEAKAPTKRKKIIRSTPVADAPSTKTAGKKLSTKQVLQRYKVARNRESLKKFLQEIEQGEKRVTTKNLPAYAKGNSKFAKEAREKILKAQAKVDAKFGKQPQARGRKIRSSDIFK
tara:strand:+ start:938 stop:1873 length:936 start_codon:yes stop_codon:yes gene_type:complete